jgi:hypothetical protein
MNNFINEMDGVFKLYKSICEDSRMVELNDKFLDGDHFINIGFECSARYGTCDISVELENRQPYDSPGSKLFSYAFEISCDRIEFDKYVSVFFKDRHLMQTKNYQDGFVELYTIEMGQVVDEVVKLVERFYNSYCA